MKKCLSLTSVLFALLITFASSSYADSHAVGAKLLDFSVPITSVTYHEDKTVINVQSTGAIGELGTVGGTITLYSPVSQTVVAGLYSSQGAAFRPDDKVISFSGRGAWKAIGKHRWKLNGVSINAEGTRTYFASVLSLSSMTISGSSYSLD